MDTKFDNRRKFKRINFDRQVSLDFNNESYDFCRIKNFNLTGIFVVGAFRQQVEENCLISHFHTAESKNIKFQSLARVIRKNDEGIAINFASMTFDSYALLVTTFICESEKPLVVQKELPVNCPFEITRYSPVFPVNV